MNQDLQRPGNDSGYELFAVGLLVSLEATLLHLAYIRKDLSIGAIALIGSLRRQLVARRGGCRTPRDSGCSK